MARAIVTLVDHPGQSQVVLVEGEKCAQSLIDAGIVATTAMHGANAPVEKTDWTSLAGKAVLIVTHDERILRQAGCIVRLEDGHIKSTESKSMSTELTPT